MLTLTHDGWCLNAGADESNAQQRLILLPKDPFVVASKIQKKLKKHFSLKNIGVLITDTKSVPLRKGTIGRALGYAGFEPIKSYIGKKDLFGRKSRVTKSNVADSLAAAAVLVMGEGNECLPLAVISDAPIQFTSKKLSKKSKNLTLAPEAEYFFESLYSQKNLTKSRSAKLRRRVSGGGKRLYFSMLFKTSR